MGDVEMRTYRAERPVIMIPLVHRFRCTTPWLIGAAFLLGPGETPR